MQGDELGCLFRFGGTIKVAQDAFRRINHRQFAIVHFDDIDASTDHGRAESEAREERRIEGLRGVGKSGEFFLTVLDRLVRQALRRDRKGLADRKGLRAQ